jgi:hypothetical protein
MTTTSTTLEAETMEVSLEGVMDANGELSTPIVQEEQVDDALFV